MSVCLCALREKRISWKSTFPLFNYYICIECCSASNGKPYAVPMARDEIWGVGNDETGF